MSSARSLPKTVDCCPVRGRYGMTQQRRSRNAAAAGMVCVMTLTVICALALQVESTLSPPVMQARSMARMYAQFRQVPQKTRPQPEMKKLLAEESTVTVPEPLRQEEKPQPVAEQKIEPKAEAEKPKRDPSRKSMPKAKPASAPKPKAVKAPSSVRAKPSEKIPPAVASASGEDSIGPSSGNAAVSVPTAAGSGKAAADRRSEALAVVLQAVERYKQYPRQARRSGAEGTCMLRVHIAADGRVDVCVLAEHSGRSVLDAAAKRLGDKLIGLKTGASGGFSILVPVHYRLSDR